ncbi:MAG: tRNA (adenosine(37)-N6)-threonylcarbamoyltransferase complex dimerization subunit type 1 TsaB [Bryobacterales bacterium]|nr:tRNA (adenosine(37)-N6)-threonylcarbamoyltransferase complex dimerization subunit type 1 TsaB [Bryobacterales bacterium]
MSRRILALDTTAEFGSLALIEDTHIVEETLLHSPDGFGHVLFPQIEALLKRQGWGYGTISGFAAASGPGSFTGVRVGLTAAKGLAEACGVKAAAVSNLKALAWFGDGNERAPLLDARRGEVYAALYDAALKPVHPETVGPLNAWLAALPRGAQIISPELERFGAALNGHAVRQAPRAIAGAVGLLAELRDPAALDANYVRRSDAELFWKDS